MTAIYSMPNATLAPREAMSCFDSAAAWLDRLTSRPGVSVVIPIFNGFEQVERLLRNPALWEGQHDVVLIDDASTDPRIAPQLLDASRDNPRCTVLTNERNLGFVRTVNIGLATICVEHDAIVLNSDAHPPPGWVLSLAICAYAFDNVATVSPLSNAAGFFSLPVSNAVNAMPDGCSLQQSADALLLAAPALNEEALATCGFCWYVTRRALDTVGRLDEFMFHRGYAEETDFCLRAINHGMRNLVALSLFVEHVGGQSFSSEKHELKARNANILKAMQPDFMPRLRAYEAGSRVPAMGAAFVGALASHADPQTAPCEAGRLKRLVLSESGASAEDVAVEALLRFRPHVAEIPQALLAMASISQAATLVGARLAASER